MPSALRYSAEAELDLLAIHAYIAQHSAASRTIRNIDKKCQLLAEMPGIGAPRDQIRLGMRLWTVGQYLVLYRVETDGIFVVRIVHGRRDLRKLFPAGGQ